MDNPYKILGVGESASQAEIKKAFRKKALSCHPDRFPDDKEKEEEFKKLQAAYAVIGDEEKRREYDKGGFHMNFSQAENMPIMDLDFILNNLFMGQTSGGFKIGDLFSAPSQAGRQSFSYDFLDEEVQIVLSQGEARMGVQKEIRGPQGVHKVTIPANAYNGMKLRLRGKGSGGKDLYLIVTSPLSKEEVLSLKDQNTVHEIKASKKDMKKGYVVFKLDNEERKIKVTQELIGKKQRLKIGDEDIFIRVNN